MTSRYYLCEIDAFVASQALDDYEANLKFQPVWVEPGKALQVNRSRLEQPNPPRWTVRETFMLSYLQSSGLFLLEISGIQTHPQTRTQLPASPAPSRGREPTDQPGKLPARLPVRKQ